MRKALVALLLLAVVAPSTASAGEPVFVLTGHGWGHGVGMSQWGAEGFARHGTGYRRILAHYYRGTRIGGAPLTRVRVLLAQNDSAVRIASRTPFRAVDGRGRTRLLRGGVRLGPRLGGLRSPVRFEPGANPLRLGGRAYRGALVVRSRGGRMSVVNDVRLELYLRGVVPWEMPDRFHPEALKAQAVVARSYAVATRRSRGIFDLYADTRSQVYGGIEAESPKTNAAIGATAGQVLRYGGRVVATYYHSTSGGRTAAARDVWGGNAPYLQSVPDPYSSLSPRHTWPALRLRPAGLGRRLGVAAVTDVLVRRNGSDRAATVVVRTTRGLRTFTAREFQQRLGLRSTNFGVSVLALRPVTGESALAGVVRGERPVVLQRWERGGWRRVRAIVPEGPFVAPLRAKTATYRLVGAGALGPPVRLVVR